MSEQGSSTSTFLRTEPDGEGGDRRYYRCGTCRGTGEVAVIEAVGAPPPHVTDCPDCDGAGEWFE